MTSMKTRDVIGTFRVHAISRHVSAKRVAMGDDWC